MSDNRSDWQPDDSAPCGRAIFNNLVILICTAPQGLSGPRLLQVAPAGNASGRNLLGCQKVEAKGRPMTAPRAGVPSFALFGPSGGHRSQLVHPNNAKGGNLGERLGERARRSYVRHSARAWRSQAPRGWSRLSRPERATGCPSPDLESRARLPLCTSAPRPPSCRRAALCAPPRPPHQRHGQSIQPLGGAHGVRAYRDGDHVKGRRSSIGHSGSGRFWCQAAETNERPLTAPRAGCRLSQCWEHRHRVE